MSSRVSLVVPDHGCRREVLGRVSLRVSFGMFLVVFDCGCGWECRWWCLTAGMAGRCRGGCCVGSGGVRSRIWVGGVVLCGGLVCFWRGVNQVIRLGCC